MKDIRQKLLAVFQIEHQDHLARIRSVLANLGKGGAAPGSPELDEAFRSAHSLKGAARAVDLYQVETLAHRLETLFARLRVGALVLEGSLVDVIHRVLDETDDLVAGLAENRAPAGSEAVLAAIDGILGLKPESGKPPGREALPVPAESGAAAGFKPVESLRVEAKHLDRLLCSAGRLLEENSQQDLLSRELETLAEEISTLEKHWEPVRRKMQKSAGQNAEGGGSGRLENRLLSLDHRLKSLAGRSRALRGLQKKSSWGLRRLGEDLRNDIRLARMVPAGTVFEGFHKMMRDLARDERKEIRFSMTGLELEADRMVLQALKDPLMHVLRNAAGHALEAPEERLDRGKDRCGQVALSVEMQGSMLRISVQDDGRGVDLGRVAETAVKQGLLSPAKAAESPPEELLRFIFLPGFSTAAYITELSGRGMGLSVVAEAVNRLQGSVTVLPRTGGGMEFSFTVPLSLSTHHLLMIGWRGQTFAIPSHGVDRVGRVSGSEIEMMEGRPVVRLRETMVPLSTLSQLLERKDAELSMNGGLLPLVFLKSGDQRLAVAVDELQGQADGLIRDLGFYFLKNRKFAGGLIQGDGTVALVLNPSGLVEAARHAPAAVLLREAPDQAPGRTSGLILVVDDSVTTRTLEKSILEANGYRVTLAVDGLEALEILKTLRPDLIISDVQMPKVNGFDLLEKVKKNAELKDIPFILLTSLEDREDQERGLALGADAYVAKRKFDQRDLLETIRQIL